MNITLEKVKFCTAMVRNETQRKTKTYSKKGQHFLVFRLLFDKKIPVNQEKYSNFT